VKYITWFSQEMGPVVVCFSGQLSHAHVARCLGVRDVRSAGFVTATSNGFLCHGHPESLKVGSLVSDTTLVEKFFRQ